jgi:hypothetical protein
MENKVLIKLKQVLCKRNKVHEFNSYVVMRREEEKNNTSLI